MRLCWPLIAAALLAASPGQARAGDREARAGLLLLQQLDQRVTDIGWKLARGNAAFCAANAPAIGLRLHDMAGYADPGSSRAVFDLDADFAILAVATGSPAAAAGLTANSVVSAIDGQALAGWPARDGLDWERLARAHDAIDASLAEDGRVVLGLGNGQAVEIEGVPACVSRFEIDTTSDSAQADGRRVVIGLRFPPLGYEPDLLAAALAHELAHNLLGHRDWLARAGRKQRTVRLAEREADRLMPWLLANAGYDPAVAAGLLRRWGPDHGGGLFRKRTHAGWDKRVETVEAELAALAGYRGADGSADWSRHFRRDIAPD